MHFHIRTDEQNEVRTFVKKRTARVIGVLQQKGGVGKTTLSLNLAACYASKGLKVLVVDADPQGSAQEWAALRSAEPVFSVIGMARPNLHREIEKLVVDYDIVLIDGAPRSNDLVRSALLASDHVLIPVQPSPFDIWAARQIVALIEGAREFKPTLTASFVISRKVGNSVIGRDAARAFAEQPFSLEAISIAQRVVFAEAAASGLTVMEVEPNGSAAREVQALADALISTHKESKAA